MGIEPTYSAWKAAALPLCYARISLSNREVPELYTTFSPLSRGILGPLWDIYVPIHELQVKMTNFAQNARQFLCSFRIQMI